MKAIINRAELASMLAIAAPLANGRIKPILGGVVLTLSDDTLTVRTTNLESSVSIKTSLLQVEQQGECIVLADGLLKIVALLADETVSVGLEGESLVIRGSSAERKLSTFPTKDFPPMPKVDDGETITAKPADFTRAIDRTVIAADDIITKFGWPSICFTDVTGEIAATDSKLLVCERFPVNGTLSHEAMFPSGMWPSLRRLVVDAESLSITFSKNAAKFETESAVYTSPLIEGNFTPYRDIIPKHADVVVKCGTADLLNGFRIATLACDQILRGIVLDAKAQKGVTLGARADGESSATIPCKVEGAIRIGINPEYAIAVLKTCDSDEITIEMTAPNRPIHFKDGKRSSVVMPVNVR